MWARLLLLQGMVFMLAGCPCEGIDCAACRPPVVLQVVDETTGIAVVGVQISGEAVVTSRCDGQSNEICLSKGSGTYTFTLSAPGYVSKDMTIEVVKDDDSECCYCGYVTVFETVKLTPS